MAETTNEIVIKTAQGTVVARMSSKDATLDGHCEWYDTWSNLIGYGYFKNGAPFTGIFLNWAKFFGLHQEDPYDPKLYCQDWVTLFESSFDSEPPKYEMVIEAYSNGRKIELSSKEDV